ncbi:hypothetical protein [Aquabacterium humicola]|uniref:hypothetical protein n=1 Tax=Aquabacterium humicola TaxID=3237377 RepID=UPI002542E172|nr:hypothetical protein [Rubrivivax pictus]
MIETLFVAISAAALRLPPGREALESFDFEGLGQCYTNAREFVSKHFGDPAVDDPNFSFASTRHFTWVIDRTATENFAWYGFVRRGTMKCLALYVPAASSVRVRNQWTAEAKVSAKTTFGKRIVLMRRRRNEVYVPTRCELLDARPMQVSCSSIYD